MDGVSYSPIFASALRSSPPRLPSISRAPSVSASHSHSGSKSQSAAPRPRRGPSADGLIQSSGKIWRPPQPPTAPPAGVVFASHPTSHPPYSCRNVHPVFSPKSTVLKPTSAHTHPYRTSFVAACTAHKRPARHHALPALYARGAATACHHAVIRCRAASFRVQLHWQLVPKAE